MSTVNNIAGLPGGFLLAVAGVAALARFRELRLSLGSIEDQGAV